MQTATIFNHETVALDGEGFSDCEFRGCRLVYAGGQPPMLRNCRFHDCEWKFEGAASSTLAFMRQVWTSGGKAQVQALIKEITAAG